LVDAEPKSNKLRTTLYPLLAMTVSRWVAVQRNPVSGAGQDRAAIVELMLRLREHGVHPRLFANRERLRRRLDDPRWRARLDCIVAAGGDGTVGDVINRFPGVPVAILPLGNENLLARHLGIPRSGHAVADMIAANHRRRLDVGVLGDRRFTLMASAGFDAEVVHRTHAARTGHITRGRYIGPLLRSLVRYRFPEMRLYLDDDPRPVRARLALIVNIPSYAIGLRPAESARGDDGVLDLRLFESGSALRMIGYFVRVLTGTHERRPDVRSVRASRIKIESDEPVPIQIDGDPAGRTPAEIHILPGAMEVFAEVEGPGAKPGKPGNR
jgi:diacylglycerol kinase family enzyme